MYRLTGQAAREKEALIAWIGVQSIIAQFHASVLKLDAVSEEAREDGVHLRPHAEHVPTAEEVATWLNETSAWLMRHVGLAASARFHRFISEEPTTNLDNRLFFAGQFTRASTFLNELAKEIGGPSGVYGAMPKPFERRSTRVDRLGTDAASQEESG